MCCFRHGGEIDGELLVTKNGENRGTKIFVLMGKNAGRASRRKFGKKTGYVIFVMEGKEAGDRASHRKGEKCGLCSIIRKRGKTRGMLL